MPEDPAEIFFGEQDEQLFRPVLAKEMEEHGFGRIVYEEIGISCRLSRGMRRWMIRIYTLWAGLVLVLYGVSLWDYAHSKRRLADLFLHARTRAAEKLGAHDLSAR
jgi:hypothetical protein